MILSAATRRRICVDYMPKEEYGDPSVFTCLTVSERKQTEDLYAELKSRAQNGVCRRIFLSLRRLGVHGPRKTRQMCVGADIEGNGLLPWHAFEGILVARSVRLVPGESQALLSLFGTGENSQPTINYALFFGLMAGVWSEDRMDVVRRAFRKLRRCSEAGIVTVEVLIENWRPSCYPEVRQGILDKAEAFDDFVRQWQTGRPDGDIPPEEFLAYYTDVSMYFDDTNDFIQVLRAGWNL